MNRRYASGLTLLELLITIAISVIMAGIGVPSFSALIQNNRMTSHANELVSSLNLARSEAAKRGLNTAIASTSDTVWSQGWTVWADTNADGTIDAGEEKLREVGEMDGPVTATSVGGQMVIAYKPDGSATASTTIRLCSTDTENGRSIEIALSGRVATTKYACQ